MLLQPELQQVVAAGLAQLCALVHKCVFVWRGGFFPEGPQKGFYGARLVNPSALACSSADCSPPVGWKQGLFFEIIIPLTRNELCPSRWGRSAGRAADT